MKKSLKFLSLLTLILSPMIAPATEIIAHRGFSARAPENTLAAFKLAWEHKTPGCELDLHLTGDGRIVVLHDATMKRTAGVEKAAAKTTLAELQALDVGSWKGEQWKGEKPPTLEESLATLPTGNHRFFLEVKCGPEVVPAMTRILEPMKDRAAQLVIIAFDREVAATAKKAMPWLKVYRLASGKDKQKRQRPLSDLTQIIADTKADGLDGVNLGANWVWNEALVKEVRDAGLGLYVWTVNDPAQAKTLAALGVDGITTDDPVLIREALKAP